jgi:hypothetical protein
VSPRYDERWVGPRFGVELELVGLRPSAARRVLAESLGQEPRHRGRVWTVVGDRSVPDGFELRTPPLRYDELPALRVALAGLRRAGGRTADAHTGLHVHVDVTGLPSSRLAALGLGWASAEPRLRRALAVHPRRSLLYCRPLPRSDEEWIRAAARGERPMGRYRSLNLESVDARGTVEFRLFQATTRFEALRASVDLALTFVAGAPVRPAPGFHLRPIREGALAFRLPDRVLYGDSYRSLVDQLLDAETFEPKLPGKPAPPLPATGREAFSAQVTRQLQALGVGSLERSEREQTR